MDVADTVFTRCRVPRRRERFRVVRRKDKAMAAPQFSAPKQRVSPSRPLRRFTLEQANRSLPLVKRIVADIVQTHAVASNLRQTMDAATPADSGGVQRDLGQRDLGQRDLGQRDLGQRDLDRAIDRLERLVDELNEVGAELKDYQSGLVDFVGLHEGRDVYLCWKLGEESITHWHELSAGFAGRKPVSLLRENA